MSHIPYAEPEPLWTWLTVLVAVLIWIWNYYTWRAERRIKELERRAGKRPDHAGR